MIRTRSLPQRYTTAVSNGSHEIAADAPVSKGGGGAGLGAHELLEAALAVCINMAVRMHAEQHSIPLDSVSTRVSLARPRPETICFEYALALEGPLTLDQREQLKRVAQECPVRKTLTHRIEFKSLDESISGGVP